MSEYADTLAAQRRLAELQEHDSDLDLFDETDMDPLGFQSGHSTPKAGTIAGGKTGEGSVDISGSVGSGHTDPPPYCDTMRAPAQSPKDFENRLYSTGSFRASWSQSEGSASEDGEEKDRMDLVFEQFVSLRNNGARWLGSNAKLTRPKMEGGVFKNAKTCCKSMLYCLEVYAIRV
jgi:hypothetical protein